MSAALPPWALRLERHEIEALQLERLRSTLDHVYRNNARYRKFFDAHGVRPDDFQTLPDIGPFSLAVKSDLRAHYPFGFFSVPMSDVARIHASLGTTGTRTVVGYTRRDLENWTHLTGRCLHVAGGKPGMKVRVAYGLFTGGLGAHYDAESSGYTVIPMSGGQTEKQVQMIRDFEPGIIMVTPSYMLTILDEFRRQGLDPRSTSLKIGVFGAEPWTDAMRAEIENAFDIRALDIYRLSEVMGPGVACEIAADGTTIWEDQFLVEVIDPITGTPLPDGSSGELVFTSLTKEALPIVRYRTRDLTSLLPGTSTAFRRMGRILGRSDDMLIIRGVNVFPTQIEELLLRCAGLAPHFEIEITRPNRMDEVVIHVEPVVDGAADHAESAARTLCKQVKSSIGISSSVRIMSQGSLRRSEGKASRVRDLRQKVLVEA